MLKIIILIIFGLELLCRVCALTNDNLRSKMADMLKESSEDFRQNGNKTKLSLVYWALLFIGILLC